MIPGYVLFTCLIAGPATTIDPPSDLTPAAQIHNRQGIAYIEAGAHAAGVDELERAYLLMPDPIEHRAGRSKVLGSIRSGLNQLYQSTGDPAHLQRLQRHLLRYLEALLVALGDNATTQDTEGSLAALREVEEALARHPAGPPRVTAPSPVPARAEPPRPRATRPSPDAAPGPSPIGQRASSARLRHAGGALLGVGLAGVGVMTYGIIVHADSRNKLQALTRSLINEDTARSAATWQEGQRLYHRERDYQTLAIVTGVASGAMLATGVALRVLGKRRPSGLARHHLVPTRTTDCWALVFTGEF